jgi:cyclohexadieny/prephenate dehydrogenase
MSARTVLFDRVSLIGLGLIGSSLARRLRRDGLAREIVGTARTPATRDKAMELGLVDRVHEDPAEAVAGADLVMICTPLGAYAELAETICPRLARGAILSDVGSVKQAVIRDLGPLVPEGVHLVPGHPVAGTEHSGPEAGFAELFDGRWCLLTPPPGTEQDAVDRVAALWRACGMKVEIMEPGHHDKVLAITSHLPHLIAYTIVGTATDLEESLRAEVIKFSAGGFRDFTRIAASDPVMWRDVFLNNREAVLEMLQRFTEDLTALQRAIRWGEAEVLESLFRRTREIRRSIVEAGQAGTFLPVEPTTAAPSASPGLLRSPPSPGGRGFVAGPTSLSHREREGPAKREGEGNASA